MGKTIDYHEMPWGFCFAVKKHIIIDDTNAIEVMKFVLDKCLEIHKKKVIIDESIAEIKISTMKSLEKAELMQKVCSGMKIAFIAPTLMDSMFLSAFETFTFNRGVFAQYFPDLESASEWIKN